MKRNAFFILGLALITICFLACQEEKKGSEADDGAEPQQEMESTQSPSANSGSQTSMTTGESSGKSMNGGDGSVKKDGDIVFEGPSNKFQAPKRMGESEAVNKHFKGKFMYFADAPLFYPCDGGDMIPVAMNKAYELLEKSYLNMDGLEVGEKVYVELKGEVKMSPAMEGEGKEKTLEISRLVKMNTNLDC